METVNKNAIIGFVKYILPIPFLCFGIMYLAGMYMGYLNKWFGFEWAILIGILTIGLEVYIMKKYNWL